MTKILIGTWIAKGKIPPFAVLKYLTVLSDYERVSIPAYVPQLYREIEELVRPMKLSNEAPAAFLYDAYVRYQNLLSFFTEDEQLEILTILKERKK